MTKRKINTNGIVFSTDPDFGVNENKINTSVTPEPGNQRLKVRLETKHRGGKAVTLVENFTGKDEDLENLGKKLKTFCGTGGSVKDGQIIIQGDQREKVLGWLKKEGYK